MTPHPFSCSIRRPGRHPGFFPFPHLPYSIHLWMLLIPGPNRTKSCGFLCSSLHLHCHTLVESSTILGYTIITDLHSYVSSSLVAKGIFLNCKSDQVTSLLKPLKRLPSLRTNLNEPQLTQVRCITWSLPVSPTSCVFLLPCSLCSNITSPLSVLGTCWALSYLRTFASALPYTWNTFSSQIFPIL